MSTGRDTAVAAQYQALTSGVGLSDFGGRSQVELTGRDRATFLNNFCTNDIRRLEPGSGCEAFITSVQGKIVAHVFVFCRADSLVIDTVAGQGERIVAHLDRYLIREDVTMHDRSAEWVEVLVAGTTATELLRSLLQGATPPSGRLAHVDAQLAGAAVSMRDVDVTGPGGFFISMSRDSLAAVVAALRDAGAVECERPAVEAARIEAGFPLYGQDITDKNLPQEVGRDALAISFTKGCYLGQETVARIDALGHVNRSLVGIRFTGSEMPPVGTELTAGGEVAGAVTSAAFSFRVNAPLALGYVRRGHTDVGTQLQSAQGEAQVVALPV